MKAANGPLSADRRGVVFPLDDLEIVWYPLIPTRGGEGENIDGEEGEPCKRGESEGEY